MIMSKKLQKVLSVVSVFAMVVVAGVLDRISDPTNTTSNVEEPVAVETSDTEVIEETASVAIVAETGTGITVTKADDWATEFPNQYSTYMLNDENDEVVDYLEESPYLTTVYEGYGFAISYGSARGHTYDIEDLYATGRPHKLANCFTCKTSSFTAAVLNEGDSVYSMDFEEFTSEVTDPFGCFHCHENSPGEQLYVTHGYLADALGDDLASVPAADLTCAQCHTEYYFDPETKATTLGYQGLDTMNPTDILAYENTIVDAEGNQFADWVDESTGVRKLKAQHPEFETYYGTGSVHTSFDLTCADCHMAGETDEDGNAYTSHEWVSPLNSETILNDTCAQCHTVSELKDKVTSIQTETRAREDEIGEKIKELDEKLTDAVAANSLSDEDLEQVRSLACDGQFLWDFIYVENSEGVHNSTLTTKTLDQAEDYIDQALAILGE